MGTRQSRALLPTREQLDFCLETLRDAENQLRGKTRLVFGVPTIAPGIRKHAWVVRGLANLGRTLPRLSVNFLRSWSS